VIYEEHFCFSKKMLWFPYEPLLLLALDVKSAFCILKPNIIPTATFTKTENVPHKIYLKICFKSRIGVHKMD